jgi:hypothetical protein
VLDYTKPENQYAVTESTIAHPLHSVSDPRLTNGSLPLSIWAAGATRTS